MPAGHGAHHWRTVGSVDLLSSCLCPGAFGLLENVAQDLWFWSGGLGLELGINEAVYANYVA
jgi:hypothetical protein